MAAAANGLSTATMTISGPEPLVLLVSWRKNRKLFTTRTLFTEIICLCKKKKKEDIDLTTRSFCFFNRGVGLVFMTSFVLLVLTVVHFLVGVFSQNLSCDVLTRLGTGEEPQQRELYDFIDRNIPLTALNPHGVVKDDLVTVSNIVKYV